MSYDLVALQRDLRACRRCLDAGYWIEPGPVFSGGPKSKVMLIGQAPGVTEGKVKRPFNAGSGRRLFRWLGEAGWDETGFRDRHYMTAVTKCYPGPSGNGKGDRVPSRAEQALCRPWLDQEIRLVNPILMILVGGLAIKLLFPPKLRLNEVIGTAAWFSPEALAKDALNFDIRQAEMMVTAGDARQVQYGLMNGDQPTSECENRLSDNVSLGTRRWSGGRFVVPLPHPSGASLWPNRPENKVLIDRAIALLSAVREAYGL